MFSAGIPAFECASQDLRSQTVTLDRKVTAVLPWSEQRRFGSLSLYPAELQRQRYGHPPERAAKVQHSGLEILFNAVIKRLEPCGNDKQDRLIVETARRYVEAPEQCSQKLPVR